jgi:2,3-bisphosphoglycerate-independent phosphoglycerate mutase
MKTILLFVDGLGWGPPDASTNPQHSYGGQYFRFPPAGPRPVAVFGSGFAMPIDAVLGVDGIPQSATGQTTLLSGVNAQGVLGKHLTGFPNEKLRDILRRHSILKTLTDRGYAARFLNAFRPRFWELSEEKKWTLSATTVTTLAAGLPFFTLDDVNAGCSVYQEFTNAELISRGFDVRPMLPAEAGSIVARQIQNYDFLLYEYFQTDKAGHSGEQKKSEVQLQMLDNFLATLLSEIMDDTLVILTSDHGNLEDATTRRHTLNPVPLMTWGNNAKKFLHGLTRLDQVAGAILARHPG